MGPERCGEFVNVKQQLQMRRHRKQQMKAEQRAQVEWHPQQLAKAKQMHMQAEWHRQKQQISQRVKQSNRLAHTILPKKFYSSAF
jgi:hypothetical protein